MLNLGNLNNLYYRNIHKKFFILKDLNSNCINYYDINKLIQNNIIKRIEKGKYVFTENFKKKQSHSENENYYFLIECIENENYYGFIEYYKKIKDSLKYRHKCELYFYLIKYLMDFKLSLKYDHKISLKNINDNFLNKFILTNILNSNFYLVASYFARLKIKDDLFLKTVHLLIKRICNKQNIKKKKIMHYLKNEQYIDLIKYLNHNYLTDEENIIIKLCVVLIKQKNVNKITYNSKSIYEAIENNDYKLALYYSEK